MVEKTFVKICPKCGSTDITVNDLGMGAGPMGSVCRGCGYGTSSATIFPEIEKGQVKKFRQDMEQ